MGSKAQRQRYGSATYPCDPVHSYDGQQKNCDDGDGANESDVISSVLADYASETRNVLVQHVQQGIAETDGVHRNWKRDHIRRYILRFLFLKSCSPEFTCFFHILIHIIRSNNPRVNSIYVPAIELAIVNMIPIAPPNSGPSDLDIM